MATELLPIAEDRPECVEVKISGKLHGEDYEAFGSAIDDRIKEHGNLKMLVCLRDFSGWDLKALWEDLKFDLAHFSDIDLLAVVGDKTWEKWMVTFCQPFTTAEIRYFDAAEYDAAKDWILTGEKTEPHTGLGEQVTPF